jgi:hypothetical protein
MGGTRDRHVKGYKPDLERQILHVFFYMKNLDFLKGVQVEKGLF